MTQTEMSHQTMRAAIVGYGGAGRGIHARLLQEAGWDIAAVTTRSNERAEQARADAPGVAVLPDIDALLTAMQSGAVRADAVVLASPSGDHHRHALQVIDAGFPLVVDKPVGVDQDQTREVVEAARGSVPMTVFQNRRFDEDTQALRQLLADGSLGQVVRAEMRWERWRPQPRNRWREQLPAEQGGGILLDLHTHTVDSVVHLFGPIREVYAEVINRTTTAEDEAFLSCWHEGGVISHLGVSSVTAAPGPRWRVLGTAGSYVCGGLANEDPGAVAELHSEPGHAGWLYDGATRTPVPDLCAGQADFYRQVARALSISGTLAQVQQALPVDPQDSLHVMAVVDAARESSRRRAVVTLAS